MLEIITASTFVCCIGLLYLLKKEKDKTLTLTSELANLTALLQVEQVKTEYGRLSKEAMSDSFLSVSSEVLANATNQFLLLAEENLSKWHSTAAGEVASKQQELTSLVNPIKLTLEKLDTKLNEVDKNLSSSGATIAEQIKALATSNETLRKETSNLSTALKVSGTRGSWGEMQLKRVAELSGMSEHCDFSQQVSLTTETANIRPDMVVNLPNGRVVVVDSKAPLKAYMEYIEADEVYKPGKLVEHAKQVKAHVTALSTKAYWSQFETSPEFTILFLPNDSLFSSALEKDPGLIDYAIERKVLIATPITLIALLKSIAYGWKQESLTRNAKSIIALGTDLYDRLKVFVGHFTEIKKGLDRTVESYNKAVSSVESRVLVSARKLNELGINDLEGFKEVDTVEKLPKAPSEG